MRRSNWLPQLLLVLGDWTGGLQQPTTDGGVAPCLGWRRSANSDSGCPRTRYSPIDIAISGDGGNIVTGLRWWSWSYSSASASGTSNIQSCIPDCASGTDTPVRTSITLEDPSSKGYFTKLIEHRNGTTEVF